MHRRVSIAGWRIVGCSGAVHNVKYMQVLLAPESDDNLLDPIFFTIAADPGLEQAVPYLVAHIAQEVKPSLTSLAKLARLLQAAFALVLNRTNNLGAYLPQLLPAIMTCLLAAKLGTPGVSALLKMPVASVHPLTSVLACCAPVP